MSQINNGRPAFPMTGGAGYEFYDEGMSLRDYFAAKAMQEFIRIRHSSTYEAYRNHEGYNEDIAYAAYAVADAMLRVREGGEK